MSSRELAWVERWKRAGVALAAQKRSELARLTEEEALRAADALLSLAPLSKITPSAWRRRDSWSSRHFFTDGR